MAKYRLCLTNKARTKEIYGVSELDVFLFENRERNGKYFFFDSDHLKELMGGSSDPLSGWLIKEGTENQDKETLFKFSFAFSKNTSKLKTPPEFVGDTVDDENTRIAFYIVIRAHRTYRAQIICLQTVKNNAQNPRDWLLKEINPILPGVGQKVLGLLIKKSVATLGEILLSKHWQGNPLTLKVDVKPRATKICKSRIVKCLRYIANQLKLDELHWLLDETKNQNSIVEGQMETCFDSGTAAQQPSPPSSSSVSSYSYSLFGVPATPETGESSSEVNSPFTDYFGNQ